MNTNNHLLSILEELSSFTTVSQETLDRARAKKLSRVETKELKTLTQAWCNGDYDEDPEQLLRELDNLTL